MFYQMGDNQESARNRYSLIFLATSSVVFQVIPPNPRRFDF